MKTILTLMMVLSVAGVMAQKNKKEKVEKIDSTVVIIQKDSKITIDSSFFENGSVAENGDSTTIKVGKLKIVIVDNDKDKKVIIDEKVVMEKDNGNDDDDKEDDWWRKNGTAYWSGIGINTNGFLNATGKIANGDDSYFLQLDHARSIGFNLNFAQKRFPIIKEYVGLTTGLGLQWNRYALKNNVNVGYASDSIFGTENVDVTFKKNFFRSTYLQVPLLLEFSTNREPSKAWHLSAGVIGGIRIGSSWRTKWEADGKTNRNNEKATYHFQPFQAMATVMLGYDNWNIYVNYGLTEVFEKGKGPEFSPVTAGVFFNF
jgi:hypothetical protein